MSFECRRITAIITEHLASADGAAEMASLMERGASTDEIVTRFAAAASPAEAALMWAEYEELPANFVTTFMTAWQLAAVSGQRFTLASRAPEAPLDFAHRGRVSYTLEHDDAGVTMYVSHVHARHAEWYKPEHLVTA